MLQEPGCQDGKRLGIRIQGPNLDDDFRMERPEHDLRIAHRPQRKGIDDKAPAPAPASTSAMAASIVPASIRVRGLAPCASRMRVMRSLKRMRGTLRKSTPCKSMGRIASSSARGCPVGSRHTTGVRAIGSDSILGWSTGSVAKPISALPRDTAYTTS